MYNKIMEIGYQKCSPRFEECEPREYKIFRRNYYDSDSPSLYYFGDKSFEIL